MIKRVLLSISILAVSIIILEILSGIYVRATKLDKKLNYIINQIGHYDQFTSPCYDGYLGYALRPLVRDRVFTSEFEVEYSINSSGIRDKEVKLKKQKGEFRIVALGESNVFGQGVDYGSRFTEVIARSLKNVTVVNMGVPEYGMDQSFLQLKRDGLRFSPDLIIIFMIKDFLERCKYSEYSPGSKPRFVINEKGDDLILKKVSLKDEKGNNQISEAKISLSKSLNKRRLIDKINFFILISYCQKIQEINKMCKEQDRAYYRKSFNMISAFKQEAQEEKDVRFNELILMLLKKYKDLCDMNKISLLVVYIDENNMPSIFNSLKALKIPYLDLSGILINASRFRQLRFDIDPHLNKFSHKVIGEYVSAYLKTRYVLESDSGYSYDYLGKF